MRLNRYFLISPRPDLAQSLDNCRQSDLHELNKPIMWQLEQPDKGLLHWQDYEELVKLMFLDTLHREWHIEEGFDEVFPGFVRRADYFEAHWKCRGFTVLNTLSDAIDEAVAASTLPLVQTDNERIREYFRRLVERA